MAELGLLLAGLGGLLFFCAVIARWNELKFKGIGPPAGAYGWPLIGETIDLLMHGHQFVKIRRLRHGDFFKTHVLGSPLVVSVDPDVNRSILLKEGKGLIMGYPRCMTDLIGKELMSLVLGPQHGSVRGLLLSLIGPQTIRETLLPKLDSFVQSYLHGLGGQIVDFNKMTKKVTILMPLKLIAGIESGRDLDILVEEFSLLVAGSSSLPISLPGLSYHRALKARKKITKIIEDIMRERQRSSPAETEDAALHSLLHFDGKTNHEFTDEQIIDILVGLVFAGHETVSAALMMTLVYLHDHPRVLQEITEEHKRIKENKPAGEAIKWEDYKSMSFTRSVILETIRLASIVPGVLRNTTEDVEVNGVSLPSGWKIFVSFTENFFDPTHYPEPFEFNPWRWQDKSLENDKAFMMFGGGRRLCPGKELAMVQISLFLHYFVTRYRYEAIGEHKLVNFFRVEASKDLPYKIWDV